MLETLADRIRQARLTEGLSQTDLAQKIGVAQPTIFTWETGAISPGQQQLAKLEEMLGVLTQPENASGQIQEQASPPSNAFGAWLRKARSKKSMSVPQLANASGLSAVAIYNIESGRSLNPQAETKARIEAALNIRVPDDVRKEVADEQDIKGLGALTDFDPHNANALPRVPGVYVFYDISERPIYIGKAANIAERVSDHRDKFWFRQPIVFTGSYVEISDSEIRHSVEQVLIKFLKSNAVINKQSVDR